MVGQAPRETLLAEWTHAGLTAHTVFVAGQEYGSTAVQNRQALEGRYAAENVLVLGDGRVVFPDQSGRRDKDAADFRPAKAGRRHTTRISRALSAGEGGAPRNFIVSEINKQRPDHVGSITADRDAARESVEEESPSCAAIWRSGGFTNATVVFPCLLHKRAPAPAWPSFPPRFLNP